MPGVRELQLGAAALRALSPSGAKAPKGGKSVGFALSMEQLKTATASLRKTERGAAHRAPAQGGADSPTRAAREEAASARQRLRKTPHRAAPAAGDGKENGRGASNSPAGDSISKAATRRPLAAVRSARHAALRSPLSPWRPRAPSPTRAVGKSCEAARGKARPPSPPRWRTAEPRPALPPMYEAAEAADEDVRGVSHSVPSAVTSPQPSPVRRPATFLAWVAAAAQQQQDQPSSDEHCQTLAELLQCL